jgi:hypothetical protein
MAKVIGIDLGQLICCSLYGGSQPTSILIRRFAITPQLLHLQKR